MRKWILLALLSALPLLPASEIDQAIENRDIDALRGAVEKSQLSRERVRKKLEKICALAFNKEWCAVEMSAILAQKYPDELRFQLCNSVRKGYAKILAEGKSKEQILDELLACHAIFSQIHAQVEGAAS